MPLRVGASTLIFDFACQFLFGFRSRYHWRARRKCQRHDIFNMPRVREKVKWLNQSDSYVFIWFLLVNSPRYRYPLHTIIKHIFINKIEFYSEFENNYKTNSYVKYINNMFRFTIKWVSPSPSVPLNQCSLFYINLISLA